MNSTAPRYDTAAPSMAARPVVASRATRRATPRPRLLILLPGFALGGAPSDVLTAAPRLLHAGCEVTVACLRRWGPMGDALEERGVRAVALGANGTLDPRCAGRFVSLLRRDRCQIIHSQGTEANLTARIIGRLAGVPVVVTSLDPGDCDRGSGWRLAERWSAPLSDMVVTRSEAFRQHALRVWGLGAGLVRTLRYGIELPEVRIDPARRELIRRDLGAGREDRIVGTVQRMGDRHGATVFLNAASLLARNLQDLRFVLVVEGESPARWRARAVQRGVGDRTTVVDWSRDAAEILGVFNLFVQPAPRLGSGLRVLLEVQAAGVPVVAARAGGVTEIVLEGETGLLVTPADVEALARGCATLLEDPALGSRLAGAARARVERSFGIDRMVGETVTLYQELLDRRGPAAARPGGGTR